MLLLLATHSDNPSTLVILHDALMAAATADKVRMTTASKVAPGALQHTAALLWPSLEQQRVAARREQLLDALQVKRGAWEGGEEGGTGREAGTRAARGEAAFVRVCSTCMCPSRGQGFAVWFTFT